MLFTMITCVPTFPHLPAVTSESLVGQLFHTARTLGFFASSLCFCLCQTNLHMRVARQTPPNRKKLCTLYSANSRGGSAAGRSATPEPIARKCLSACAVSSIRSSWVLHRPTACGLHCPFAAAVVTKSRRPTLARPFHSASFSPLHQQL